MVSYLSVEVEGIRKDVLHSGVVVGPEVDGKGEEGQDSDDGIEGHGPSEAFDGHLSDGHHGPTEKSVRHGKQEQPSCDMLLSSVICS